MDYQGNFYCLGIEQLLGIKTEINDQLTKNIMV